MRHWGPRSRGGPAPALTRPRQHANSAGKQSNGLTFTAHPPNRIDPSPAAPKPTSRTLLDARLVIKLEADLATPEPQDCRTVPSATERRRAPPDRAGGQAAAPRGLPAAKQEVSLPAVLLERSRTLSHHERRLHRGRPLTPRGDHRACARLRPSAGGRALVPARVLVIEHQHGGGMVIAAGAGELPEALIGRRVEFDESCRPTA